VENIFLWITRLFAFGILGILGWIALQVALDAWPAIQKYGLGFLAARDWNPVKDAYGVLPMVYGTLVSSAIALLLAVPLGVGTAIFLSENFLPRSLRVVLSFMVELLAAIPSVVYGLWGIYVLVPRLKPIGAWLHQQWGWMPVFSTPYIGPGMLPAGLILTVMILPLITAISRDSLLALSPTLRQTALGMGATRWTAIFQVLIPAAFSGIVGGTMLALGRAMGETMAVTMVIGNSNEVSASILAPANSIASLLANQFAEARGFQIAALMYAGLVLFALTLGVNVVAEWIVKQVKSY
jgi:phosphate transport system permease protein